MNNSKSDIVLVSNNKMLETGTSNLLFVKDKKFFTPRKDYYEGNTYKFIKTKIKRIIKKDILLKEINDYDEILLLGSGKGITSVKTISEIKWKRKNLKKFKFLSKYYEAAIILLIPRREGDVENPQGGVRSVIPNKQHYLREK